MKTKAPPIKPLELLIHDVYSRCSSLKSAAGLLRKATPKEAHELLGLMAEQAGILEKIIRAYQNKRSDH